MNSDFGADIFGADEPPPPPSKRSSRRSPEPPPRRTEPPAEPEPEPEPEAREAAGRSARQERPRPEPESRPEPPSREPVDRGGPRRERDDDGERRPRRRRRRGRGGDDRGSRGDHEDRGERGDRGERPSTASAPARRPAPQGDEPPRGPPPGRQVANQRLAIFVDADRLTSQASAHDGEIAFRRLLQQLANGRPLVRAVAYVGEDRPSTGAALTAQGLDVEPTTNATAAAMAMAVDAMAVASRVDCIVLVPGSPEFAPLVRALRILGVRVEAAGFEEPPDVGPDVPARYHRLGRECLFVP